jgi:hypothetical protein
LLQHVLSAHRSASPSTYKTPSIVSYFQHFFDVQIGVLQQVDAVISWMNTCTIIGLRNFSC